MLAQPATPVTHPQSSQPHARGSLPGNDSARIFLFFFFSKKGGKKTPNIFHDSIFHFLKRASGAWRGSLQRKQLWPEDVLIGSEYIHTHTHTHTLIRRAVREHHSPTLMIVTSVPPRHDTCCSSICCSPTLLLPCIHPTNHHQPSINSSSGSIHLSVPRRKKKRRKKSCRLQ